MINALAYVLSGLADPGPLRKQIDAQLRECLDSKDPIVLANALHVLAGVEGFSTVFTVPDVAEQVPKLLDHPAPQVAAQARADEPRRSEVGGDRGLLRGGTGRSLRSPRPRVPVLSIKGIDWKRSGRNSCRGQSR